MLGMRTIIIVGGGAAGMMAASAAAEQGARVVLLEKNAELGKKLLLTGGGRCNITNTADVADFVEATLRNPSFLYSALYGFDSSALREFLHGIGLATKIEDGGRVFPVSEDASDVIKAFAQHLDNAGVEILTNATVAVILPRDADGFLVGLTDGRNFATDAVIVATGGLSVPHTGSTGDGHRIARDFGHSVTKLYPSLVPFAVERPDVSELMGLSVPDVGLVAKRGGKVIYRDFGDVIFTHLGISGPVVLRTSAHLAKNLHEPHEIYLDFMPNKSEKDLDNDILRIFEQNPNKDVKNCMTHILPARLAAAISNNAKAHDITKEVRRELCRNIKAFRLDVSGSIGFGAAVITCGGVSCDEIDPGTMQSKLVSGLYFAGEVVDVDALTGGYNLQIAFSTGRLAGKSASLA